ncbi:hypothetical protein ACFY3O_29990 [Streptomyces sp. NPDC001046]|uniref:hypothetical protein n=1 Tax=Streptomyces sp. NPDC001046 TaxID=3364543 RepID=UPI00367CB1D5
MSGHEDQSDHRYDRARDPEEPGSHSGAESQDRSIPGTASNREGYRTDQGTTAGKPLEGVEAEEGAGRESEGTQEG